jgi:hypothetical protein
MARKPKVYAADIDGLHEWIVAAPNQAEALAAFGISQNLFAQGRATTTSDEDAVAAAAAAPGVPLRRLKGSSDAFAPIEAVGDEKAWSRAAKAAGVKPGRAKPKVRDRRPLDAAEAKLEAFEAEAEAAIAALDREQAALDARRGRLAREQAERRAALDEAVAEAKRRFEAS